MNSPTCPYCGPAPTNHRVEYVSVFLAFMFTPFDKLGESIRRYVLAPVLLPLKLDCYALFVFRILTWLKLGTIKNKADDKISLRAKALWESADKLGITIYEFRLFGRPLETYVAVYQNQYKFFYEMPRPARALSPGYWWMDDKPAMRNKFAQVGIPVALGASCFRLTEAIETFRALNSEVIIKPSLGSRSRHTFVHIKNEDQLRKAFQIAKQLSPFVVVEQQLQGLVYRASVIGGELAGVISRNPPTVVGDGGKTIRMLVEIENQNPNRTNGIFHPIPFDPETETELARQNFTTVSVPDPNKIVYLSDKVSRGVGAVTVDVTDKIHPENKILFEKIAQVLDDSLVGIDFIIADISNSWKDQKLCGVIECNSMPFLDLHHYPYSGQSREVSTRLWQLIFRFPRNEWKNVPEESVRQSA